ncbi:unnamed protein product [Alopecurus aequalis]
MALMGEPMVMYEGGFEAEASAFDALGYGSVHTAALSDFGRYGYAHDEPAGASSAYVPDGTSWAGAGASVLTFDRPARGHAAQSASVVVADEEADCDAWSDVMDEDQASSTIGFDPVSGCFSLTQRSGGARRPFGLLFPSTSNGTGSPDDAAPVCVSTQKRPRAVRMQTDAEPPAAKRQCGASRKMSKPKPAAPTTPPKDPQSLVAKPNGTKVDMVTMLEKAISYVKFLQLQVKVLATDEFWPEQGGMAPEISQVKEALDAILSSSPSSQRGQLN